MGHLIAMMFGSEIVEGMGLWLFLSVGAISLFGIFLPLVTWIEKRAKEREEFYKAETVRRMAESSGEGAKAAMELMREDNRQAHIKRVEGMKIAGLINLAVGVALVIFLHELTGDRGPYLCGLIPGLIGVAMLAYVFFMAKRVE